MQWCWKEGRCWGIDGTHHAGGLGSLLLQQASFRGMWDHLFVVQMQGGFHPVKMHYTAFDKTELVIKENLRIFFFQMKCPSLSLITASPRTLDIHVYPMTTLLCLCRTQGMYCAVTAVRRCASTRNPHHRILCCFSLTWQNCNEKKAVIWLWYLDWTYQNSSFAFATLTLDCIWHFKSIMLENSFLLFAR